MKTIKLLFKNMLLLGISMVDIDVVVGDTVGWSIIGQCPSDVPGFHSSPAIVGLDLPRSRRAWISHLIGIGCLLVLVTVALASIPVVQLSTAHLDF